ncbi:hypothetical protein [Flavobacterium sp. ENC]|uniref:hypothetical protein n=1 Tax=Flavobacterium sp. ENC TaxID=2897330 RepID=UPI001E44DC30|nr:hypothetical protein [Flavobacterium sp. ENC]MCD0465279.1 hypothetical protein [Flavobacterium sp. ENC]
MEFENHLTIFKKAATKINQRVLNEKGLEIAVGEVLNSVFLKLYKKSWTNSEENPLTAETRIFFSIWVDQSTLQQKKIFYNIHALKLRKLNGYSIESRKFANSFREEFKKSIHNWKNISIDFGPLTLMQGWIEFDNEKAQEEILQLANNFLEIENIIDKTLTELKKNN